MSKERFKVDRAIARTSVLVKCSIEKAFAFVCDPQNDPQWLPKIGPGKKITGGPIRTGTRFRQSVLFLGRHIETEWELTEYVINKRAEGRSIRGPLCFDGGYEFRVERTGTYITKFGSVHLSELFSFVPSNIANSLLTGEFEKALQRLKLIFEAGKY